MELYKPSAISQVDAISMLGYTITPKRGFKEYNAVKEAMNRRRFEAKDEMRVSYLGSVHSTDDLLGSAVSALERVNRRSAEFAASVLMYYGIDHVSADTLLNHPATRMEETDEAGNTTRVKLDPKEYMNKQIGLALGPVIEKCDELDALEDGISAQRHAERSSRSKWVASGYGIRGAITGAIKAGALNAGTSVLRGIGDSVVDASDAAKIARLRKKLIKNEDTIDAYVRVADLYAQLAENLVFGYLRGTIEGAPTSGNPVRLYQYSDAASKKAYAKFENITMLYDNNQMEDSEYHKRAIECLLDDLWHEDMWWTLYATVKGDQRRRSIIQAMPYLGVQFTAGATILDLRESLKKSGNKDSNAEEDKKLIQHQQGASPDALASEYVPRAYLAKNGFYIETIKGGLGSMEQNEYAMQKDAFEAALPIIMEHKGQPFNGSARLTTSDYIYSGEFHDGKIDGEGTIEYADGETFKGTVMNGNWHNGLWQGPGNSYEGGFIYENGQHLRHGEGRSTYTDGIDLQIEDGVKQSRKALKNRGSASPAIVEGQFDHNKLSGPVKISSPVLKLDGLCEDHIIHGEASVKTPEFRGTALFDGGHWVWCDIKYNNGESYRGDVVNTFGIGKSWARTGRGTGTFADGSCYEGDWKQGQLHGTGTMRSSTGETYTGEWQNNKRQGHGTLTDSSGNVVYEGEWVKDKMKGEGLLSRFKGRKKKQTKGQD